MPCVQSWHTIRSDEKVLINIILQVASLELPNLTAVAFSPKATYLTTFQRLQPGTGSAEKNLKVM